MTSDDLPPVPVPSMAVVLTPTSGVEPRDALATSMFASPGVYAVLIGSGVSTAAGVLTGARIVEDLVQQVARQRGVDPASYEHDVAGWWMRETGHEPRYDELLSAIATTDAGRQALLHQYFETRTDTGTPVAPTAAHEMLAQLCAAGYIRVILTTNFDGLIEQALDAAGVTCQVLVGEEAITARIPLVHAGVTLIKLHGDYRRTGLKNSPEELASYGSAQQELLRQVLEEYGLITIGWSAEWDRALGDSMQAATVRRYPMYWVSYRGDVSSAARQLMTNRQASHVVSDGADEFLLDLERRVNRLANRARRRKSPALRRQYQNQPTDGRSNNWSAVPWLTLRTAATTNPVNADSLGLIGPEAREKIILLLESLPMIRQLEAWNTRVVLDATPPERRPDSVIDRSRSTTIHEPHSLSFWEAVPGLQSANRVAYRLGGDGRVGVSAVAVIRMPDQGYREVLTYLDIGVSLDNRLALAEVIPVLRDGLVLVTSELPDAVADILPVDVTPVRCDVHLMAGRSDGEGHSRNNSLKDRVNLDVFRSTSDGGATNDQGSWGFGAEISEGLTAAGAGELLTDGLNYSALTAGFLDPRSAIAQIRAVLGLPNR